MYISQKYQISEHSTLSDTFESQKYPAWMPLISWTVDMERIRAAWDEVDKAQEAMRSSLKSEHWLDSAMSWDVNTGQYELRNSLAFIDYSAYITGSINLMRVAEEQHVRAQMEKLRTKGAVFIPSNDNRAGTLVYLDRASSGEHRHASYVDFETGWHAKSPFPGLEVRLGTSKVVDFSDIDQSISGQLSTAAKDRPYLSDKYLDTIKILLPNGCRSFGVGYRYCSLVSAREKPRPEDHNPVKVNHIGTKLIRGKIF